MPVVSAWLTCQLRRVRWWCGVWRCVVAVLAVTISLISRAAVVPFRHRNSRRTSPARTAAALSSQPQPQPQPQQSHAILMPKGYPRPAAAASASVLFEPGATASGAYSKPPRSPVAADVEAAKRARHDDDDDDRYDDDDRDDQGDAGDDEVDSADSGGSDTDDTHDTATATTSSSSSSSSSSSFGGSSNSGGGNRQRRAVKPPPTATKPYGKPPHTPHPYATVRVSVAAPKPFATAVPASSSTSTSTSTRGPDDDPYGKPDAVSAFVSRGEDRKHRPSTATATTHAMGPETGAIGAPTGTVLRRTKPNSIYKPFDEASHAPYVEQWKDARTFLSTFGSEKNAFALLQRRALRWPNRTALTWIGDDGEEQQRWTFADLLNRARGVARFLSETQRIQPGQRVVLCYPPGLDFFVSFWACLSLGVVAVPVTPPDPFVPEADASYKLMAIADDCEPVLFLTTKTFKALCDMGERIRPKHDADTRRAIEVTRQRWCSTDDVAPIELGGAWDFPTGTVTQDTLAFLQYTSGSTGNPKGVLISHRNLLVNAASCCRMTHALDTVDNAMTCVTVSWLPTFHDMGLIGFHVTPLLAGGCVANMSPLSFVANPLVWLKVLSQFTRPITGAPPFALEMCVEKLKTEVLDRERIDLTGMLVMFLGAAPILDSTLMKFAAKFKPYGFRAEAFAPSFGLAENVLFATGKSSNQQLTPRVYVDQSQLRSGQFVEIDAPCERLGVEESHGDDGSQAGQWMVSSGEITRCKTNADPALPAISNELDVDGGTVLCVNPDTCMEVPDGTCGEIWICGQSIAGGYWKKPAETREVFNAKLKGTVNARNEPYAKMFSKFLRTGDLGAIVNGHLYVTGRIKDMIIVNGANFFPADIQAVVGRSHPAIRPGSVVAFPFDTIDAHGTAREALGVIAELRPKQPTATKKMGGSGSGSTSSTTAPPPRKHEPFTQRALNMLLRFNTHPTGAPLIATALALFTFALSVAQKVPFMWLWLRIANAVATRTGLAALWTSAAGGALSAAQYGYDAAELSAIESAIRKSVLRHFHIAVSDVVLARIKTIPKTTSGKLRNRDTRIALADGKFDAAILYRPTPPPPRRASSSRGGTAAAAASSIPTQANVFSAAITLASAAAASVSTSASSIATTPMAVSGLLSRTPGGSLSVFRSKPLTLRQRVNDTARDSSDAKHSCSGSGSGIGVFTGSAYRLAVSTELTTPASGSLVTPASYAKRPDATPRSARPAAFTGQWASPPPASAAGAGAGAGAGATSGASIPESPAATLDVESVKAVVRKALMSEFDLKQELSDTTSLESLGMDSLKAVALTKKLSDHYGVPLSVFMLVADPTLEGVAKAVVKLHAAGGVAPIDRVSVNSAEGESDRVPIDPARVPHILGIGTAVPKTGGPQKQVIPRMADIMGLTDVKKQQFIKIGHGTKIETRYMVLSKLEDVFFGRKGPGPDEGIEARNEVFKREAPLLAVAAAEKALADWGGDKHDITHVVGVTCTGVIIPGLEFEIMTRLGLQTSVERLGLVYMGCFGAVSGIKTAKAIAAENAVNRVLVVCCELCSLHMQFSSAVDNLIASALFSDGAGAIVMGSAPRANERSIFEVHHTASVVIPNTTEMMKWELSSTGMIIGLSKQIPDLLYGRMAPFVRELLGPDVQPADCAWAVHPGGPMIVHATMEVLNLPSERAHATWQVLRDYGNMSSATLVFVLDALRKTKLNKAFVPALAFGPGLNVEGALLKASS